MENTANRRFKIVWGLGLIVALCGVLGMWCVWTVDAADESDKSDLTLRAFMRRKLDASSQILEGLTTEDAELIERGANSLLKLSNAEKWQILSDSQYREHSLDFRLTVKKLVDAAEKRNFDNATLQWFDAMKGCIECHQHVRRERAPKNG